MDLNFGEIIVDPVSRAFYDDYEDDNLNYFCRPEIKWNIDNYQLDEGSLSHFILVEGVNINQLLRSTILKNATPICSIKNVRVYELDKSTVLCTSEETDLNYFSTISDHLDRWINAAKEVTLVSLQSLANFKTDVRIDDCVIRGINSKFDDIERLNIPNFITGIAASIGTKQLINGSSFACYVIYVDLYDEITIRKILGLLKRCGLSYDESIKIKAMHQAENLYM